MLKAKITFHKAVRPFIERLETELDCAFFRYAENTRLNGAMEPAFWYREQQTKTFITMSLGNLCAGAVLQEPPITRRSEDGDSQCRADYFCTFGEHSFFIEFKQHWMHATKKLINIARAIEGHRDAVSQIKRIKSKDWGVEYAIAMTLAPIWRDHKKDEPKPAEDSIRVRAVDAWKRMKKEKDVDAVSYFPARVNRTTVVTWKEGHTTNREWYPGVFILWTVRKI